MAIDNVETPQARRDGLLGSASFKFTQCGGTLPEGLGIHGAIGHQRIAADRGTELDNRVLVPAGGEIRKCPAITD